MGRAGRGEETVSPSAGAPLGCAPRLGSSRVAVVTGGACELKCGGLPGRSEVRRMVP